MRAQKNQKQLADDTATLMTHVRELQIRLLITGVVLVGAGVVAYIYYGQILDLLRSPLNAPLYYNSVSGSFSFVMKICMVAGIAVSVPLIIYNFIMFVRPAFEEIFTRKRVFMMTFGSVLAAAGGAAFGFLFVIPGALHFFSGFQVHGLKELISADSYLNFVINTLITFILMFQLPIVVSLIDRIKPISPRAMIKGEKWALIGSVLIAFVVPFAMDFTTQILIAAPIFLLYNLSFIVVTFQHSYARKVQKKILKVEAKAARKLEKTNAKPVRTAHHGRKTASPMPVAAAQALAPHPQLAEVLALQATTKPLAAKTVHTHPQAAHRVSKPVAQAPQGPTMDFAAKPRPMPRALSMDMAARTAPTRRMQPTNVIRQAGAISAPQRPHTPVRSMNLLSDIR